MYTSTYLATCSENLPLELLRKSRFSPCYGTWSLLSRIQGQSHGSSHTASLQYRFCLKICGMVPTILGVSGQPKQRSATGVAVTGNPGLHARSKERRARKVTTVYGQSSVDNNVMHLVTSVLMISSLRSFKGPECCLV